MATYYVRADGVAANKAAATSAAAAATSMSIATHNGETFSADDFITISDAGGVYRGTRLTVPSSGSAGHPITYIGSGSPVLKGSIILTSASYSWTASGSGTNEWYVRTSGGGNPSLIDPGTVRVGEPGLVFIDDTSLIEGTLGSLADHEYSYGDNDSLGYSTIYVRDNTGDPDTSGVLIEASQVACFYIYNDSYIVVDGLEFRHGWGGDYQGGFMAYLSNYSTVQNCESHWNDAVGISFGAGCNYCTIDNCTSSYNGSHGLQCSGSAEDNRAVGNTIKNSVSHHTRVRLWSGENEFDGYGIKFQWTNDSFIYNNETYSNDLEGVDLDVGCDGNEIYENEIHDNQWNGILMEIGAASNKVYRNRIYDNMDRATGYGSEITIWNDSQNNEIYYNVIYKTRSANSYDFLILIGDSGATASSGTKIYNNVLDGGGYSNNAIHLDGGSDIATAQDMKIKNNIIINTDEVPLWLQSSTFSGFECDYNCFDVSGGNIIQRGSGTYPSYTLATHFATLGQDEHSIDDDPMFVDEGNNNYALATGSPCINTGVDLGADYDDGILPASTWPSGVVTGDQDSY